MENSARKQNENTKVDASNEARFGVRWVNSMQDAVNALRADLADSTMTCTLTEQELELLAEHYLRILSTIELKRYESRSSGCFTWFDEVLAHCRLGEIAKLLGNERLDSLIGALSEEFTPAFDELEAREAELAPCSCCGGKRELPDLQSCSPSLCSKCKGRAGWAVDERLEFIGETSVRLEMRENRLEGGAN